jgi:hypothetical protein
MALVFGTFGNPHSNKVSLFLSERLVGARWRHHLIFVRAENAQEHCALVRLARDESVFLKGVFSNVESQVCGAFIDILAMASEAVVVEDWSDVSIVLNHARSRLWFKCRGSRNGETENPKECKTEQLGNCRSHMKQSEVGEVADTGIG